MKLPHLLGAALLLSVLCLAGGCAAFSQTPEPSEPPEEEMLAGVVLARSGGSVYGQDFHIQVEPGRIQWMYLFLPDGTPVSGGPVDISDSQWQAIADAVAEAELEEDVPRQPSFWEKILEKLRGEVEVLDGVSTTELRMTWQSGSGTRTADYVWRGDLDLWNVLYDLAQSKAAELPLEED